MFDAGHKRYSVSIGIQLTTLTKLLAAVDQMPALLIKFLKATRCGLASNAQLRNTEELKKLQMSTLQPSHLCGKEKNDTNDIIENCPNYSQ